MAENIIKEAKGDGGPTKASISYLVTARGSKSSASALDASLSNSDDQEHASSSGSYLQAEILIEQVASGSMTIGSLSPESKQILYTYLAKFSPLVSRIIRLHTKLPMSSMRLQKPKHDNNIIKDYIYAHFETLLDSEQFKSALEIIIRSYWVYGVGLGKLEDDWFFSKTMDLSSDTADLFESLPQPTQEVKDKCREISELYMKEPETVTWDEKKTVIEAFLPEASADSYKGVKRFTSINPLEVAGVSHNLDVGYFCYDVPYPAGVKAWMSHNNRPEANKLDSKSLGRHPLHRLGYSKGALKTAFEQTNSSTVAIDSQPFGEYGQYIVRLAVNGDDPLDNSILNSVLEPAIHNMQAIKASNSLVGQSAKIDRIVAAKGASDTQLSQLTQDLADAAESEEGSLIAVNFDINIEEISLDVRDKLDLDSQLDRTSKEILSTLGMPEELVSEGGSYGSGFLKVELLSQEYIEFRQKLKSFIEDQIFKPIAIKKGFITIDPWGNPIPLIPRIKFDRLSLSRSSEDFSQIMDLVQDEKLPIDIIYDYLGLEAGDIEQKLLRQKTSIFSDSVSDMLGDAISELSTTLGSDEDFLAMILSRLGHTKEEDETISTNKEK